MAKEDKSAGRVSQPRLRGAKVQRAAAPPQEPAPIDTVDVTQETLDATPARLLAFLRGVGTRPAIQAALAAVGYDAAEHNRGWTLLHACSGFHPTKSALPALNRDAIDAINTLDAQDERIHGLVDATLKHRAPEVHAALLDGLAPGQGAESVVFFHTLLERLDALHAGRLEGVSAAQRAAAVAVLEKRGLTAAWRSDQRALVQRAERFTPTTEQPAQDARHEAMQRALEEARAFYEEWSQIARRELHRKDYLIVLGLATRKAAAKPTATAPATTPTEPQEAPAVPVAKAGKRGA